MKLGTKWACGVVENRINEINVARVRRTMPFLGPLDCQDIQSWKKLMFFKVATVQVIVLQI